MLWTRCRSEKEHLKAILEVLVEHGRSALPPVRSLLAITSETATNQPSDHLAILREVVANSTIQEDQQAALVGWGEYLKQMTAGEDTTYEDVLTDVYDLCEIIKASSQ